jgi:hypothetical protein
MSTTLSNLNSNASLSSSSPPPPNDELSVARDLMLDIANAGRTNPNYRLSLGTRP